jgi:hypothetical protein
MNQIFLHMEWHHQHGHLHRCPFFTVCIHAYNKQILKGELNPNPCRNFAHYSLTLTTCIRPRIGKYVAPNPRFGEIGVVPTPQPRLVKKNTCELINNHDDFLFTPHKNKDKQLNVAELPISRNISYVQYVPKEKAKLLPKTKLPHQSLVLVQCK